MKPHVLEDIPIPLDPERILRAIGRYKNNPKIHKLSQWACETVGQTARPKAIIGLFQIEQQSADCMTLFSDISSESVQLNIGKRGIKLIAGAHAALIGFATLGGDVLNFSMDFAKNKNLLKQYIFDTASIFALHGIGKAINEFAENIAAQSNWRVSRRISPGDLNGWAIDEQCTLGKLLPIETIGVEIKKSGLLYPLKSASSLIAMGPDLTSGHVGTVCKWCRNQKTCPIRMSGREE